MRVLRAAAAALLVALTIAPAVLAQGPLEMFTAYPAVTADPGSTPKFPVTVITDTAQRVDLTVVSAPDGWDVTLRGAGSTVSAVFTAANPDVPTQIVGTFTAEVKVADDAVPATNQVVIEAHSAAGNTARLTLDITTEEQSLGSVELSTDFPNLRGSTSTAFRFNLQLANNTNQQLVFGLETDGPPGWDIEAKPSGDAAAATATLDAGATTGVAVTADPPSDEAAGTYDIVVRAVGGPAPVETHLTIEITGSFALTLDTVDGRLNARVTAGQTTTLNVVITNSGTSPLTNVNLTATPPRDWKVTFDPATVATIPAGATNNTITVPVTIQAANNALAGDYLLTIRASSQDESSATAKIEVRTTVDTSPLGYLIGVGILVVVGVGLFFVFQRYGRR